MNVPYFIRIKRDNEKSKKRLLAVNMYMEFTCTLVVRLSPTVWILEI